MIDRTRAHDAFAAYVAPYDPTNERIRLKVEHTYRVAELADRIARSIPLPDDDVDLAWLCGLLHDVGRFEQVRRWDTFRDAASTSHARLGARELFGERRLLGTPVDVPGEPSAPPRIRDFVDDPTGDALVRDVVATHSDFRLPAGLDARTRTFATIVRDADKVDILRTVQAETPEAILGCDADALFSSALSQAATEAFDARRCMRREERAHPADFLVGFACFAFELIHPESRRAMAEQGHATRLLECPFGIDRPFSDPRTASELARMRTELAGFLSAGAEGDDAS